MSTTEEVLISDLNPEAIQRIKDYLRGGFYLYAVKEVKVTSGKGLRESKWFIDAVRDGKIILDLRCECSPKPYKTFNEKQEVVCSACEKIQY